MDTVKRKKLASPLKRKERIFVWIVLIPVLAQYTLTSVVPLFFSLFITFYDWSLMGFSRFAGVKNWVNMLKDPGVWGSLQSTVNYALLTLVLSVVIGLALALIVNTKLKGMGFFKALFFLPVVTSAIVVSNMWRWFFSGDAEGIVNALLGKFGIEPLYFFGPQLAIVTVALLGVYKGVGLIMVYFYAGLKGIPCELYEAARIDGASSAGAFFKITLPLLTSTFQYVLIVTTAGALKVFDSIYTIWPNGSAPRGVNSLVYYIYRVGFYDTRMGYASTIGYLLFFIIFAISFVQYVVLDRRNIH
jgi:multiple sugar transport system permease protein